MKRRHSKELFYKSVPDAYDADFLAAERNKSGINPLEYVEKREKPKVLKQYGQEDVKEA